jgi:hypothetical protein
MQMRCKDFRCRCDRQPNSVEISQCSRTDIEEEEVTLGVTDLDEKGRGRLALLNEWVTAAQNGYSYLIGSQRLGTWCQNVGVSPTGVPTTGVVVSGIALPS